MNPKQKDRELFIGVIKGDCFIVDDGASRKLTEDFVYKYSGEVFLAREVSPDKDALLKDALTCLDHILEMDNLTPGGSTEGWVKMILSKAEALKEGK